MGGIETSVENLNMARTIEDAFDELVKRLQPSNLEYDKAARHRSRVYSCLERNFDCYRFFETGSFGSGTGVRGYSDIDYFAVCKSRTLPDNSGYVLTRFRDELRYTFHATESIRVNTPAVRIEFGTFASEVLEIVPTCFLGFTNSSLGQKAYYSIPDYSGQWVTASPEAHNAYVQLHNRRLNGRLKPLIQLLKAWKYFNNAEILSFYLELRATKFAESKRYINYEQDFVRVLNVLSSNGLARMQDPMGISGYVLPCKTDAKKDTAANKVATALERGNRAIEAMSKNKVDEAFRLWRLIFNYSFPAR